ncbi:MAG: TIGR03986 family CRISPR-associated RAMP protein [Alkaliphilus sp.]
MTKNNSKNVEYAYAPYNFVRLPKNIISRYNDYNELPKHNMYSDELLSGYIEYEIEAKTDIMICSGTEENDKVFFKNEEGRYAIPGTSIRGLIRTTSAMLSSSSLGREISDKNFLYRKFASETKKIKDEYGSRLGIKRDKSEKGKDYSLLTNLKAGYIYKRGKEDYAIIPSGSEDNSAGYIRITENKLKTLDAKRKIQGMHYFSDHKYVPYSCEISFNLSFYNGQPRIEDVDMKGKLKYSGFLVSSGKMHNKKNHYIIFKQNDEDREIELTKEEVRAYILDLQISKNKMKYYAIPEKTGLINGKPVFYARHEENNHFGFTPYLRLLYDNSIYSGIDEKVLEDSTLDYVKSMFGFTSHNAEKKLAYKTRLGFEDAVTNSKETKEHTLVAGEPKASCLTNYLVQKEGEPTKSYNDDDFEIRGLKQYFLKKAVPPKKAEKERIDNTIRPLEKGSRFKGRINFSNLHEDELGLIVWALKLEKGCKHNIGYAKAYGFGQIGVENVVAYIESLEKKYSNDLTANFYDTLDSDELTEKYKDYIKNHFSRDINNDPSVKDFMFLKRKVLEGNEINAFEYMKLGDFEDHKYLPSVEDLNESNYFKKYVSSKNKDREFGKRQSSNNRNANKNRKTDGEKAVDPNNHFAKLSKLKFDK